MTLGQFKDKIEKLEKEGLITDDFELIIDTECGYEPIINIEVDNKLINSEFIRLNIE